jgi:hypothetical protein
VCLRLAPLSLAFSSFKVLASPRALPESFEVSNHSAIGREPTLARLLGDIAPSVRTTN